MKYKVGDKVITKRNEVVTIKSFTYGGTMYGTDDGNYTEEYIDHEATAKLTLPQPSKDMLRSGMKVVERCGIESFVLMHPVYMGYLANGEQQINLKGDHWFKNDLTNTSNSKFDIMQIWDGDTLISQRTDKSEAELKKESLEKQINECSDKIKNLHVCIENLELEIKSL